MSVFLGKQGILGIQQLLLHSNFNVKQKTILINKNIFHYACLSCHACFS